MNTWYPVYLNIEHNPHLSFFFFNGRGFSYNTPIDAVFTTNAFMEAITIAKRFAKERDIFSINSLTISQAIPEDSHEIYAYAKRHRIRLSLSYKRNYTFVNKRILSASDLINIKTEMLEL